MGDAGAPASAEEAHVAVDAVAVKAPASCTTTGTVPTKALDAVPKLTREEMEAEIIVLRETMSARNARIGELDRLVKEKESEMEGSKLMKEIKALDARYTAELVRLEFTHDCTCFFSLL